MLDLPAPRQGSIVFKHITSSGHKIDVNDVATLHREKNWLERGVKGEWVRKKSFLKLRR